MTRITFTTRDLSVFSLLGIIAMLSGMIIESIAQNVAQRVKTTRIAFAALRHWLNTSHDYSNEEGTIILTGWQCLKYACIVAVAAVVLSLRY